MESLLKMRFNPGLSLICVWETAPICLIPALFFGEIRDNVTEFKVKDILTLNDPPDTNCYTLCKLNNVLCWDRCINLMLLYWSPLLSFNMVYLHEKLMKKPLKQ